MDIQFSTVDKFINDNEVVGYVIQALGLSNNVICAIRSFLNTLREELRVVIETGYVDMVYRDCYYNLYSRKRKAYSRDCVRLSFFEPSSLFDNIETVGYVEYSSEFVNFLHDNYRGFLVLRPLPNGNECIGRNCLDVRAKKCNDFRICKSKMSSSCLGVKLSVEGFPHSSQDGEYMTCAETTVWGIVEYYGYKYPDYRPVLPSSLLNFLTDHSYERVTPSHGLNSMHISSLLKQQGFETLMYSNGGFYGKGSRQTFEEIFVCYIESGFPLAVCLENENDQEYEGHAVICIGRKEIDCAEDLKKEKGDFYFKWYKHVHNIIFSDDNFPPYKVTTFLNPLRYYNNVDNFLAKATITGFIVPLPKKVYLKAEDAIDASEYLARSILNVPEDSLLKTFLVSCRSYRNYLATCPELNDDLKGCFLGMNFPKFIWITEIATRDDYKNSKVSGVILLDATGDQYGAPISLLMGSYYNEKVYFLKKKVKKLNSLMYLCSPLSEGSLILNEDIYVWY